MAKVGVLSSSSVIWPQAQPEASVPAMRPYVPAPKQLCQTSKADSEQQRANSGQAVHDAAVKLAVSGGIAGALSKTCTAPLSRLTILYQVNAFSTVTKISNRPPDLAQALTHVVRQEGLRSLWKGNTATILHRLPYSAINFTTYEFSSSWLQRKLPNNPDVANRLAAGAVAGMMACTAAYPLDLVRTRLAAQTQDNCSSGIYQTLRCIIKEDGLRGLYRGLGATLLQVVPSLAVSFAAYESSRAFVLKYNESAGALSGSNRAADSMDVLELKEPPDFQDPSNFTTEITWDRLSGCQPWGGHMELDDHHHAAAASVLKHERRQENALESIECVVGRMPSADGQSVGPSPAQSVPSAVRPASISPSVSFACGCLSGLTASTLTFPLDVIRRRLQVGRSAAGGARESYASVIQMIYSQGGWRAFYTGIVPEYCKVVPGVAIAFCTYEYLKSAFGAVQKQE